jgi:hypothetical protein
LVSRYTNAPPRTPGHLRGLLDDARAKGVRVVESGRSPEDAKRRAHTLPPTLVLDVHDDMRIMPEEIFVPVLPIVRYRDLAEAIARCGHRVVSHETQVGPLPWLGRAFLAPRLHAVNQAMFDDLDRAAGQ